MTFHSEQVVNRAVDRAFGSFLVSVAGDQDVEHIAILIHRS